MAIIGNYIVNYNQLHIERGWSYPFFVWDHHHPLIHSWNLKKQNGIFRGLWTLPSLQDQVWSRRWNVETFLWNADLSCFCLGNPFRESGNLESGWSQPGELLRNCWTSALYLWLPCLICLICFPHFGWSRFPELEEFRIYTAQVILIRNTISA